MFDRCGDIDTQEEEDKLAPYTRPTLKTLHHETYAVGGMHLEIINLKIILTVWLDKLSGSCEVTAKPNSEFPSGSIFIFCKVARLRKNENFLIEVRKTDLWMSLSPHTCFLGVAKNYGREGKNFVLRFFQYYKYKKSSLQPSLYDMIFFSETLSQYPSRTV